jgi:DNA-binding NarL/FixJ family response regulator
MASTQSDIEVVHQGPPPKQRVLVIGTWLALQGKWPSAGTPPRNRDDACRILGSLLTRCPSDLHGLREQCRSGPPDWLLIGQVGSDDTLRDVIAQCRLVIPGARLAMLGSRKDHPRRAESWIRRGCTVYLCETSSVERVLLTLDAATRLDLQVFDHTLYLRWQQSRPDAPNLTARQREVLRLIVDGYTNAEVSRELYLTQHTVEFHIRNLLQKLGVRNRTEAAERARMVGICLSGRKNSWPAAYNAASHTRSA